MWGREKVRDFATASNETLHHRQRWVDVTRLSDTEHGNVLALQHGHRSARLANVRAAAHRSSLAINVMHPFDVTATMNSTTRRSRHACL